MSTDAQFGANVRRLRESKELSQADLAKRLGIQRPTVSEIEAGRRSLKFAEAVTVANVLGVSLYELAGAKVSSEWQTLSDAEALAFRLRSASGERLRAGNEMRGLWDEAVQALVEVEQMRVDGVDTHDVDGLLRSTLGVVAAQLNSKSDITFKLPPEVFPNPVRIVKVQR